MNKLFIIIGCLVLALTLGLTLAWPKYQDLRLLQTSIKAKELELESQKEYFSQIKEISEQFEEYTDSLDKISSAFPEVPSLPSLFNFLQTSASQTGLLSEQIILNSVSQGDIRITIKLSGSYAAFKDFLLVLEKSARMIDVEDVVFNSPKNTDEQFEFVVQIKTQ